MDLMPVANLSKVWNDKSWISRIFEQIAGGMAELAALEFDQIGRLDWDAASEKYRVVPFPDGSALLTDIQGFKEPVTPVPFGPFDSAHSFLFSLLSVRRQASDSPMLLAVLQIFLASHTDGTLDEPPFVFSHLPECAH